MEIPFAGMITRMVHAAPAAVFNAIISLGIYAFGWGFADPFFGQFLNTFSAQYGVIGLLMALINGMTIIMVVPVGALLERVSRRQVFDIGRMGYVGVGVLYVVAGYTHSFLVLILALICNGLFLPFVWTSIVAILEAESTEKTASAHYGMYTAARQLFWAVGLLCALVILPYISLTALFIPVMIFPLVSMWYSHRIPDPQPRASVRAMLDIILSPRVMVRNLLSDLRQCSRELWVAYITHFSLHVLYTAVFVFLPLFIVSQGYSLMYAGFLVCILSIPFIFSVISSGLPQATEHWRMVVLGAALSTTGFFSLYLFHDAFHSVALGGLVVMIGYACVVPAIGGIITALTPKQIVGTSSALIDVSEFGSALVAAPVIGYLIDTYSWQQYFFIMTVYLCIVVCVVVLIRHVLRIADVRYMNSHPHIHKHRYVL